MDYFLKNSNSKINMTIIGKTLAHLVMNKKNIYKFFYKLIERYISIDVYWRLAKCVILLCVYLLMFKN
jgi:hypothetical protein